jgi:hypothetical protein
MPDREDIPITPQMSSRKGIAWCNVNNFLVQMAGTNALLNMYPKAST